MITQAQWHKYINKLSKVNATAASLMQAYVARYGTSDRKALIEFAHYLTTKYGNAAAELACQMFEYSAEINGIRVSNVEPADVMTIGETAKAVNGTLKNGGDLSATIARLVKQAAVDTTVKNGERFEASFAWIPSGDTCAYCLMMAGRGWQKAGYITKRGKHAEHIHANCDCYYAVAWKEKEMNVGGYNPDAINRDIARTLKSEGINNAEELIASTWNKKTKVDDYDMLNAYRRARDSKNRDKINLQKREAYARRKEKEKDGN